MSTIEPDYWSEAGRLRHALRVREGLAEAARQGRHPGRPRIAPSIEAEIRIRLQQGQPVRRIALALHVGNAVIQRIAGELQKSRSPTGEAG